MMAFTVPADAAASTCACAQQRARKRRRTSSHAARLADSSREPRLQQCLKLLQVQGKTFTVT